MSAKFTNVPVTFNGVMVGRADVDPNAGTINIMIGGHEGRKLFSSLEKGLPDTYSIGHCTVITDTLYEEQTAQEAEKQANEDVEDSGD